jgi:tRNA nucleotidyltransferase (CCA-adding enzyme)
MKIYEVGGAIRDELLGLEVHERDWVVVGATPEQMAARGFRPVGRDFPVFLHPETGEEYALARTERKTAPGYRGFETHSAPDVTLEQDLERRDLTINAIARDASGALVDPFGGRRDIEARVLRHVSAAFVEDPVRILRVARFAARFARLGFVVADDTLALMARMVAGGEAGALVAERVWQETEKALCTDEPQVYFRVLRECGALAVVFPELDRLFGVPQPERWHPEVDTGVHTFMVLEQAARLSSDPRVRFAALMHDLGKGTTPPSDWPRHPGHEARSVELLADLGARLRVPRDYQELAALVARYHGHCHRMDELRDATVLDLLEGIDAFRRPARMEQFVLACEADARGRTGFELRPYPQATALRACAAAAAAVRVLPEEEALGGEQIRQRIRTRRIASIAAARRALKPESGA